LKIRNTSTLWEPTFVLPLEEKNLIENREKYEESFKKKIIAKIDNNVEQPIFQPKPNKKNNHCMICKSSYEDYLEHIRGYEHAKNLRDSPVFSKLQNQIAGVHEDFLFKRRRRLDEKETPIIIEASQSRNTATITNEKEDFTFGDYNQSSVNQAMLIEDNSQHGDHNHNNTDKEYKNYSSKVVFLSESSNSSLNKRKVDLKQSKATSQEEKKESSAKLYESGERVERVRTSFDSTPPSLEGRKSTRKTVGFVFAKKFNFLNHSYNEEENGSKIEFSRNLPVNVKAETIGTKKDCDNLMKKVSFGGADVYMSNKIQFSGSQPPKKSSFLYDRPSQKEDKKHLNDLNMDPIFETNEKSNLSLSNQEQQQTNPQSFPNPMKKKVNHSEGGSDVNGTPSKPSKKRKEMTNIRDYPGTMNIEDELLRSLKKFKISDDNPKETKTVRLDNIKPKPANVWGTIKQNFISTVQDVKNKVIGLFGTTNGNSDNETSTSERTS